MDNPNVFKEAKINLLVPPPNTLHFQYPDSGRSIILYPDGVIAVDGEECVDSELIVRRLREWAILHENQRKERYNL